MADEAFALSPISARAAQPSEEDYAAIHTAFMETSRGRWFLGEYARRNRNADTRLVLDAVARIEESLTTQKETVAEAGLTEALASIRTAVAEAQAAANAGLDGLTFDAHLAPIARSVRIIREISWRWRETGADGRICDILDSQVAAIEGSAGQISAGEARAALDRAFSAIEARIDEYWPGGATPEQTRREARVANVVRFPTAAEEAAQPEAADVAEPVAQAPAAETPVAPAADTVFASVAEASVAPAGESFAEDLADAAEATAPIADVVGAIEVIDESAADAHDEAVLDLIAAEMSAPQSVEDDFGTAVAQAGDREPKLAEPAPAVAEASAPDLEQIAAPVAPPGQPEPPAALAPAVEAAPPPTQIGEAGTSIGAAVIASGILKKSDMPANDPLAPIRRMSQAEKVAFFS